VHDVSGRGEEDGSGATLINSSATVPNATELELLEASKHDFNQQLAI